MSINGKTVEIGLSDLLQAGSKMGIKQRRCKEIIREVADSVDNFQVIAQRVGIKEKTCEYIDSMIAANRVCL